MSRSNVQAFIYLKLLFLVLHCIFSWEPIESFNGSEHIVKTFWERTNTHGRDIRDLTLFQAGEVFLPLGPPRKQSHPTSIGIAFKNIFLSRSQNKTQVKP